jgi:hypothetical protein
MDKMQKKMGRARDTGLAITLILILSAIFANELRFAIPAAATLLLSMTVPMVFSPLAPIWFGLSLILGTVMSRVILTILFFAVLFPLGIARRLSGADPLALKSWRSSNGSVFVNIGSQYKARDLEKPF